MKEEVWKIPPSIKGGYMVSNYGRIKNKNGLIMKPCPDKDGYMCIHLGRTINGKSAKKIHRLVAECFIENPNNLPIVNHKDENKSNNYFENLEWCTVDYNNKYGNRLTKVMKPIIQKTKDGKIVKKWKSAKEVERTLGWFSTNITRCLKEKIKTCHGFVWEYDISE